MRIAAAAFLLAFAAMPVAAGAQAPTPAIRAALADSHRPAADRARDAARHPGELLAFAGIRPGQKVADFLMGAGYFTRILSPLVGPRGHVYAYQADEFIAYRAAYRDEQQAGVAGLANTTAVNGPLTGFTFAEPLDAIVTVQNWHDMHLSFAPPGFAGQVARRLYGALKPGGVLLVVDHVAATDPNFAVPNALHRIDPAAARAELEAAGFRYDGESRVLRNPADPHTANVFDPAIRGHTDQFVYRFRRPRG